MRPFHDEVPPCLADEGSDLSVPGIPGIQELQVDARDGKVLSSEREDTRQEVAERKKDATPKR
jgi:hypothetical protein